MKKTLLTALALLIFAVPCFADVLPARRIEKDPAAEQAVQDRLVTLGVTPAAAERHVADLTTDEVAYFAHDTGRIQPAGRLYWYEWVFGAAVLVGVGWTAAFLQSEYYEQGH